MRNSKVLPIVEVYDDTQVLFEELTQTKVPNDRRIAQLFRDEDSNVNLNFQSPVHFLNTPIHFLVRRCSVKTLKLALSLHSDANVNVKNSLGQSAVFFASDSSLPDSIDKMKVLLQAGGDLMSCDLVGNSCLLNAIFKQNIQMVELILSFKPDVLYVNDRNPVDVARWVYESSFDHVKKKHDDDDEHVKKKKRVTLIDKLIMSREEVIFRLVQYAYHNYVKCPVMIDSDKMEEFNDIPIPRPTRRKKRRIIKRRSCDEVNLVELARMVDIDWSKSLSVTRFNDQPDGVWKKLSTGWELDINNKPSLIREMPVTFESTAECFFDRNKL